MENSIFQFAIPRKGESSAAVHASSMGHETSILTKEGPSKKWTSQPNLGHGSYLGNRDRSQLICLLPSASPWQGDIYRAPNTNETEQQGQGQKNGGQINGQIENNDDTHKPRFRLACAVSRFGTKECHTTTTTTTKQQTLDRVSGKLKIFNLVPSLCFANKKRTLTSLWDPCIESVKWSRPDHSKMVAAFFMLHKSLNPAVPLWLMIWMVNLRLWWWWLVQFNY